MPRQLPRVPPLLGYLLHRQAREESDRAADTELDWNRAPPIELPSGLELSWIGTSGFRLAYEGVAIWIDPYLTRIPLTDVLLRRARGPSAAEVDRWVDRADAVLIGHAHFDHAMDAPLIARRHGAAVYGSPSVARLMELHGLRERAVVVEPYRVYEIGPFEVTFVPSVHSRLVLGLRVPYDGELSCDHLDELVPSAYRCGQGWGIHIRVGGATLYHQGSADLLDDAIVHRRVDVFLAGIAGRGFTERYLERILPRLEPRAIVPHHYDDFFRPLDGPLGFSFNVDLAGFADEVAAVSKDFAVRTLPHPARWPTIRPWRGATG